MEAQPTSQAVIDLRILATTDLHAHLVPYDYFNDRPVKAFGLTQTAALIETARAEARQSLLFDNGDFLQGSAIGDYLARGKTTLPHAMMTAFQQLNYDAGSLGNHEFNFGLPFLARVLAEARHPVVAANVMFKRGKEPHQDQHFLPPFAILQRRFTDRSGVGHDLRIGVIGLTPPQILQWDRQHLEGKLQVRDMVEAAEFWVPRMRRAGADLIVALAHTGVAALTGAARNEDCATDIAAIDGIDAVIAGHSHLPFPGPDNAVDPVIDPVAGTLVGKPAVLPGHFGSHLGVIDLVLRHQTSGWTVASSAAHLRAVSDLAAGVTSQGVAEVVRDLEGRAIDVHRATRRWIRRDIGQTAFRLHSYFALVADSMTLGVLAKAQADYVADELSRTEFAGLPLLSAVAPAKAGGRSGPANYVDIPKGPLALRHAADLCPFPNTVSALRLTGAELADWLERSVSIYHVVADGWANGNLINDDFASFQHDRIFGLGYDVDLAQPARYAANGTVVDASAARIRNLTYRGQRVDPGDAFVLATNSFRAGGAGYFLANIPTRIVLETRLQSRDMLARYLQRLGHVPAPDPQLWRFAAMSPGTSAVFETAPEAMSCMAEPLSPELEPREITETGFRRFRLQL